MKSSPSADAYRNLVDSHFHTQSMLHRGMDVFSAYDRLFGAGFAGGIDIGCTHDDLPERAGLLKNYPAILLAGAMGPWEAGKSETHGSPEEAEFSTLKTTDQLLEELEILENNIKEYKVSFIGEIGLDYYWKYGNPEKQHLLFETQMKWASRMGLCVLIHDRDADGDTAEVIKRLGPDKGGIIHCFDGSETVLKTALERNYYISFAGNLTYKSSDNLREILKRVPLDRLLFETDSPYLTPVPMRGRPNSPENVFYTYSCASEVLNISLDSLKERVLENFKELCSR